MGDEQALSEVLSEFARTLVTDFPVQAILDHLVVEIVGILPVDAAGVTLISPSTAPRYVAASDASALRFEQLQTELNEGPCRAAYATGKRVSISDLATDVRFPKFAARALDEGLGAVFTFPLRQPDHCLGALDLYRRTPGPMDDAAIAIAETLADVAAAYLHNAEARAALVAAAKRAHESTLYDPLTGLANRTLLLERLDEAILRCQRSRRVVGLLFADLDRFKLVNDTYGHQVGDELLVAVGERLTRAVQPDNTVARLAGDEFVVLCADLEDALHVEIRAAEITAAFAEPFSLPSTDISVSASIGVAYAGRGADLPEQVLADADAAMYQAKREGGARFGIADARTQRIARHRAVLHRDLRGALERCEIFAEYQPIVAIAGETVTGVEALLRWRHPIEGLISPALVVSLAEQSGLGVEVGHFMLARACTDLAQVLDPGSSRNLRISVNVAQSQLASTGFVGSVADLLAATGIDPRLLMVEVTESTDLEDDERCESSLVELKRLGVEIALDDFGTGYSGLGYMTRLAVDVVKIDRIYVAALGHDPRSRLVVGSVIDLAHSLGMRVVAEGVEERAQLDELTALGCDSYQGYYFSGAVSATDVAHRLAESPDARASA
jgi:diguanylate cyclase (GGDEF)-like protein